MILWFIGEEGSCTMWDLNVGINHDVNTEPWWMKWKLSGMNARKSHIHKENAAEAMSAMNCVSNSRFSGVLNKSQWKMVSGVNISPGPAVIWWTTIHISRAPANVNPEFLMQLNKQNLLIKWIISIEVVTNVMDREASWSGSLINCSHGNRFSDKIPQPLIQIQTSCERKSPISRVILWMVCNMVSIRKVDAPTAAVSSQIWHEILWSFSYLKTSV